MWKISLDIMWISSGAHYFHLILSSNYGYPVSSPLNLYSIQIVFRHRDISDIFRDCLLIMTFQIQPSFTKAYEHRRVQEEFNWIWNVERQNVTSMVEYIAYPSFWNLTAGLGSRIDLEDKAQTIEFLRSASLPEYEYTLSTQLQSITETQGW